MDFFHHPSDGPNNKVQNVHNAQHRGYCDVMLVPDHVKDLFPTSHMTETIKTPTNPHTR